MVGYRFTMMQGCCEQSMTLHQANAPVHGRAVPVELEYWLIEKADEE